MPTFFRYGGSTRSRGFTLRSCRERSAPERPRSESDQAICQLVHRRDRGRHSRRERDESCHRGSRRETSVRIVLLKSFDQDGFVFFTNYESTKGKQLEANPFAALGFYWIELDRQIRISGKVEKTSREESQVYFHSRPVGSQLSAWASRQSKIDRRAARARCAHGGDDRALS